MNKKIKFLVMVLCGLIAAGSLQAEEYSTLETMTVTANKVEENVQDVASSLSVFSADQVDELKMDDVEDISMFTPNFTVFPSGVSGTNAPGMRGMFADLHSHSVSVGLYVDGVPILDGMGYEQALINMDRIEVLKGPQGTLYGKGSGAGVVNIITKAPDNEFRLPLSAEIGSDGKIKMTGTVSGAVVQDKFYASLSFLHDQKDGWVDDQSGNSVDDMGQDYLSGKLRFTPTQNLDIIWNTTFLKYDNGQPHMNLSETGAMMYGVATPSDQVTSPSFDGYDESEIMSHSLKIEYMINNEMKLTSTSAYREVQMDSFLDYDFIQPTYLHFLNNNEMSRLSEELRLNSVDTKIKWVVGLYGDKDEVAEDYRLDSVIPGMAMTINDAEMTGTSWSVFGHVNIPFGDFSVLGGVRYDYQEREFKQPSFMLDLEEDWNEISPKVGLEYRVTDKNMVYASASKGYLSGSFNAYARTTENLTYDEEKLWSYEIGVKNTLLDNKLIFNVALFYMDITDAQVIENIDAATTYTTNAAKVTNKGLEAELIFMPMPGVTFNAGIGYSDAQFDEFSDATGDYSGNRKPYAPEYTFNAGVVYRASMGWYCGVNVTGTGEVYTDKQNTQGRDAFALVNGKLGYEAEHFDVYLYGKNIFDEEYDSNYSDGLYDLYSKPAEYGLMLAYRF